MTISIIVDDKALESVKTDMDTPKGIKPCVTVGDLFEVNEVVYDSKNDLLYVDDVEARANVRDIQLGRAGSIEVIRRAKTDIKGKKGSSLRAEAEAMQEIILRRNEGVQVRPLVK